MTGLAQAERNGSDLADFVRAIGDAVVVSDPDGAITVWNAAAERIFGFSAAEALGRSLDLITPERHRRRHWVGYAKTMRTGVTPPNCPVDSINKGAPGFSPVGSPSFKGLTPKSLRARSRPNPVL